MEKLYFTNDGQYQTCILPPEGRVNKETIHLSNPKFKRETDWYIFISEDKKELYLSGSLIAEIRGTRENTIINIGNLFLQGVQGSVLLKEKTRERIDSL